MLQKIPYDLAEIYRYLTGNYGLCEMRPQEIMKKITPWSGLEIRFARLEPLSVTMVEGILYLRERTLIHLMSALLFESLAMTITMAPDPRSHAIITDTGCDGLPLDLL